MKTFSKYPEKETKEIIECRLCSSDQDMHTPYLSYSSYQFVKCTNCSLVFQNPQPVFKDIADRYDSEYFDYEINNEEAFFNLMMLGLKDIGFDRLDFSSEKQKMFLDIGCATGRLLSEIKSRGWAVAGVEICKEACIYGNKTRSVNIVNSTLEQAAFKSSSFSAIHASHLIEHLNDPVSFFNETFRILMPDRYLILVTPNIDGFQAKFFKTKWRSAIPDHLYLYSPETLSALAEKAGFKTTAFKTWGGLAKGTVPGFIKKIVDKAAKKYGFGDVMIMLFQKN